MTIEIRRRPRRRQRRKDHNLPCTSTISIPKVLHERLPGISDQVRIFAPMSDVTREPIRFLPTVAITIWAGIPTTIITAKKVLTKKQRRRQRRRARPDGGWAKGGVAFPYRRQTVLGSNSLIDLVVFGRRPRHCLRRKIDG